MAAPAANRASSRTKARTRAPDILIEADLRQADPLAVLAAHVDLDEPPVRPFTSELVEGVVANLASLDRLIATHLSAGWTLQRMPRVDRNLARIAAYELVHTDVSPPVAVAESVALAEELSTDDSPGFLNGVLRAIAERQE